MLPFLRWDTKWTAVVIHIAPAADLPRAEAAIVSGNGTLDMNKYYVDLSRYIGVPG
jgi:hypothetical protein